VRLQQYADGAVDVGHVGIVIGAISAAGTEWAAAGCTGRRGRCPDDRTIFRLASLSKVFTATALASAVTTGDIALDEPVLHHITYRHLATHTAGLPRGDVGLLDALQAVPGVGFEYPLGAPSGGLYGTIADLLVFVRQYLTPDAARRLAVTDRLCWMVDGERVWQYRDVRGRSRRRCALRAQAYRWPRPPCQDRLNSVTGSGTSAAANRFR
jgi:CubicO group peptidase (beta-lactamase class C family)